MPLTRAVEFQPRVNKNVPQTVRQAELLVRVASADEIVEHLLTK